MTLPCLATSYLTVCLLSRIRPEEPSPSSSPSLTFPLVAYSLHLSVSIPEETLTLDHTAAAVLLKSPTNGASSSSATLSRSFASTSYSSQCKRPLLGGPVDGERHCRSERRPPGSSSIPSPSGLLAPRRPRHRIPGEQGTLPVPSSLSLSPPTVEPIVSAVGRGAPPPRALSGTAPATISGRRRHPHASLPCARATRATASPGVAGINRTVAGSAVVTVGDVSRRHHGTGLSGF